MMPVAAIASEPRCLDAEHCAYLSGADLSDEVFKARPFHLTRAGTAQILVDHFDLLEAELARVIRQAILPPLALLVVDDLPGRRLPNVNDGTPLQMIRRYFRIHRRSPSSH